LLQVGGPSSISVVASYRSADLLPSPSSLVTGQRTSWSLRHHLLQVGGPPSVFVVACFWSVDLLTYLASVTSGWWTSWHLCRLRRLHQVSGPPCSSAVAYFVQVGRPPYHFSTVFARSADLVVDMTVGAPFPYLIATWRPYLIRVDKPLVTTWCSPDSGHAGNWCSTFSQRFSLFCLISLVG
jgi:hypothetical protein